MALAIDVPRVVDPVVLAVRACYPFGVAQAPRVPELAASVPTPADEPGNLARPHAENNPGPAPQAANSWARKIKATNDGIGLLPGPTLSTYG
jgi:hypothetical protein